MQVIWHGQSFFELRIKSNNNNKEGLGLAIDPFDETLGLKVPKVEAQILLVTHSHHDHDNVKAVQDSPFLIKEPGEYELKGVFIKGIPSFHDDKGGKERGPNIIYKITAEGIKICHLGDLGQKELDENQLEEIGDIDILFVPVGGTYTVDAKGAAQVLSQIEPRLVVPMHYKIPKLKLNLDGVEKFLKIMGAEKTEPRKKLKITSGSLPKEETEIIVLEP